MRVPGRVLAAVAALCAGGPAVAGSPQVAAQAARPAAPLIVDGIDVDGTRLHVVVGQPVTIRIPAHVIPNYSYRLTPVDGVRQVGEVALYRYPPSSGVGFTHAYDLTLQAEREGLFRIEIFRADDRTGRRDTTAPAPRFELSAAAR